MFQFKLSFVWKSWKDCIILQTVQDDDVLFGESTRTKT